MAAINPTVPKKRILGKASAAFIPRDPRMENVRVLAKGIVGMKKHRNRT